MTVGPRSDVGVAHRVIKRRIVAHMVRCLRERTAAMRTIGQNPSGIDAVSAGLATADLGYRTARHGTARCHAKRRAIRPRWIGSVTVDRAGLHQVTRFAGWCAVLLPAPESGAVYVEGRRLLAGDAVLLPPGSQSRGAHACHRLRLSHRVSGVFAGFAGASAQATVVHARRGARGSGLPMKFAPCWIDRARAARFAAHSCSARRLSWLQCR